MLSLVFEMASYDRPTHKSKESSALVRIYVPSLVQFIRRKEIIPNALELLESMLEVKLHRLPFYASLFPAITKN
ncbi:hypothetical protein D918_05747 [Trichuris suis]|nr:hypothetical protein D918_05747 [Trichuris suis]